MKTINILILSIIICFCSACYNPYPRKIDYPEKNFIAENVQLNIESEDSIITNELHLKCTITNCDTTDVAIILWPKYDELYILEDFLSPVIIYTINGKKKIFYPVLHDALSESRPDIYIILKAGEKKEFDLSYEFQYLQYQIGDWEKKNTDFGAYTIKLIYNDLFQLNKKAIKGRVESNKITVNYMKE